MKRQINEISFLIVESLNNHFSFPKGHSEFLESEVDTAIREIKEETNIDVEINTNFREVISYMPNERSVKNVIFFVAKAINEDVVHQKEELKSAKWMSFDEAYPILSFTNDKKVLSDALNFINLSYLGYLL